MTKLALVLSTLVIFALVFATMSALATRPIEWEFEAVIHGEEGPGPSADTCSYYWEHHWDGRAEIQARHCIATVNITGNITGKIDITQNLNLVADGSGISGNIRLRATITADDGEFYKMKADLTRQNGVTWEGPFKINGREGHIRGWVTAVADGHAFLNGTGIRH